MKTYRVQSPTPHRPRVPVWLAFVVPALLAVFVGVLIFASSRHPPRSGPKFPMPAAQFKALVVGKSQEEIKDLLGTPQNTYDAGEHGKSWVYRDVATDPDTGKTKDALLLFDRTDGRWVCTKVTLL